MDALTAVLKDLYLFVFKYHFGFLDTHEDRRGTTQEEALPEPFSPHVRAETHDTRKAAYSEPEVYADIGFAVLPDTFLYVLPTRTFDGVVTRLQYGASFRIINTQGKWMQVDHHNIIGWIHEDDVTRSKQKITPKFTAGIHYAGDQEATLLLRASIDDQFHAAALNLVLQDIEYVSYKLNEHGHAIEWPPVRPRIAGTWQKILKGVQGVHLGIHPKNGSVMEYINEDNTGHVAFVESVYPDESITISEVGFPEEGIFYERTLTKEEWVELRPIFIEVA